MYGEWWCFWMEVGMRSSEGTIYMCERKICFIYANHLSSTSPHIFPSHQAMWHFHHVFYSFHSILYYVYTYIFLIFSSSHITFVFLSSLPFIFFSIVVVVVCVCSFYHHRPLFSDVSFRIWRYMYIYVTCCFIQMHFKYCTQNENKLMHYTS